MNSTIKSACPEFPKPQRVCVHIFDHKRQEDTQDGLKEGHMMTLLLNTLGIQNELHEGTGLEELLLDFKTLLHKMDSNAINIIHWSGHGNENGVELSSGKIIRWDLFWLFLTALGEERRRNIVLCFSSCKGANAVNIGSTSKVQMYGYIIGPTRNIAWHEAAVAYVNFYNAILHHHYNIRDAVKWMNLAIFSNSEDEPFVFYNGGLEAAKNNADNPAVKRLLAHIERLVNQSASIYNN